MSDDEAQSRLGDYLSHMLEAAQLAREYVLGVTRDDFLKDRRTQQAVVLNLMTIGEAAARIVNERRESRPRIRKFPGRKCEGCVTVWFMVTST